MRILNLNRILILPAIAAAGSISVGCVTDPIYNTDHPEKARVTITTDWSDRGEDVDQPDSYTVTATGVNETAAGDSYTLQTLLDAGNCTFTLFNDADGITVNGKVATVNPVGNSGIELLPGWLFSGTSTAALEKDSEATVNVAMHQQIRHLKLFIVPEGGTAHLVTGIKATLSGVAGAWDMSGNIPSGEPIDIVPVFTRRADGKWEAVVRLIGITGSEQKLTAAISISGTDRTAPLESDMTGVFAGFNDNKKTPLQLSASVEVFTEAEFTATIKPWEVIMGGNVIAW